jgi:hypothetical protein
MHEPLVNAALTRRFYTACNVIITIGILNFVTFVSVACYLGGDAVNGKAEGGHYYLFGVRTEGGHKVYTEVSKPVFDYSRWHVYVVWVSWPPLIAAAYVKNRRRKRDKRQ